MSRLVEECAAVAGARLAEELAAAEEARSGLALDGYSAARRAADSARVDCLAVQLKADSAALANGSARKLLISETV